MEPGADAPAKQQSPRVVDAAALREEVVGTGRDTRQMRILIAWSLAIALPVLITALGAAFRRPELAILGACFGPVVFGFLGYSVAVGMVDRYHERYRDRLRLRLAALPEEQRSQLLDSLSRETEGDTRRIVAPLLEEPRPQPTEIAPSAAPEGTGQELNPASPAEEGEQLR